MDMIIHRQLEPLLNWTNSTYVPEEYEVPSTIEQTHNVSGISLYILPHIILMSYMLLQYACFNIIATPIWKDE